MSNLPVLDCMHEPLMHVVINLSCAEFRTYAEISSWMRSFKSLAFIHFSLWWSNRICSLLVKVLLSSMFWAGKYLAYLHKIIYNVSNDIVYDFGIQTGYLSCITHWHTLASSCVSGGPWSSSPSFCCKSLGSMNMSALGTQYTEEIWTSPAWCSLFECIWRAAHTIS